MAVDRYLFGSLVFTMNYHFARLERNFCRSAGLYQGQPRIMTTLQENEGVSLSELSGLCGIGLPSLSVSVKNLQKSGLIRKEGTGKNQKLFLTDDGKARARIFHVLIDKFYADLLAQLGPEKSQQLNDSMVEFDRFIQSYNTRTEEALS